MPFPPRPVDTTLHGVVDYTAGATLLSVFPNLAGVEGDIDAVRRAKAEDPHRKIYNGTPAVRPAAATT